jgi:hypothetical protein
MQGIQFCMGKRILIITIIKSILFYKRNTTGKKKKKEEENNTRSNIGSQSLAVAERVK